MVKQHDSRPAAHGQGSGARRPTSPEDNPEGLGVGRTSRLAAGTAAQMAYPGSLPRRLDRRDRVRAHGQLDQDGKADGMSTATKLVNLVAASFEAERRTRFKNPFLEEMGLRLDGNDSLPYAEGVSSERRMHHHESSDGVQDVVVRYLSDDQPTLGVASSSAKAASGGPGTSGSDVVAIHPVPAQRASFCSRKKFKVLVGTAADGAASIEQWVRLKLFPVKGVDVPGRLNGAALDDLTSLLAIQIGPIDLEFPGYREPRTGEDPRLRLMDSSTKVLKHELIFVHRSLGSFVQTKDVRRVGRAAEPHVECGAIAYIGQLNGQVLHVDVVKPFGSKVGLHFEVFDLIEPVPSVGSPQGDCESRHGETKCDPVFLLEVAEEADNRIQHVPPLVVIA